MADWIGAVEAAYRLTESEQEWLSDLLLASAPLMPKHVGTYGFTYDATNPASFLLESVVTPAYPPNTTREQVISLFARMSAADVSRSFGRVPCATASQLFGDGYEERVRFGHFEPYGICDTFGANAMDPTGRGTGLAALLPERTQVDRATVEAWTMMGAHVAGARRLRRSLGGKLGSDPTKLEPVEAVVNPKGKLDYVANAEVEAARSKLEQAVLALLDIRGRVESERGVGALEDWPAMVQARWSLVDHVERDGKHYIVAVRNEAVPAPGSPAALDKLTLRERQIVGFTLLGRSTKALAYELGISPSTARVLLARALNKLHLKSARELLKIATEAK